MTEAAEKPRHATFHCRHYSYRNTGLSGFQCGDHGGPTCAAGVDMAEPGSALKCMPEYSGERCGWREEYTDEERATWRALRDESMARMIIIMAEIPGSSRDKKNKPEWGRSGSLPCPACKAGTVRWSRARVNGHVHAACSTPNCFEVIE
jgi:hypothetical protein